MARASSPVLAAAGHVVESATSLAEARARLRHLEFDVVALDGIVDGESTSSLNDELQARGLPLVLCSRSSVEIVPARGSRRQLTILYTPHVLLGAIVSVLR